MTVHNFGDYTCGALRPCSEGLVINEILADPGLDDGDANNDTINTLKMNFLSCIIIAMKL